MGFIWDAAVEWLWYGWGMVRVWLWYMLVVWLVYGFGMVCVWFWVWFGYGLGVVVVWLWSGWGVVRVRLWGRFKGSCRGERNV